MKALLLLSLLCVFVCGQTVQFGDNPYYYEHWCDQHHLEYLDDRYCQKKFPSSYQREGWSCPTSSTSKTTKEYLPGTAWPNISLNNTAFKGLPGMEYVDLAVVMVRRPEDGSAPLFHYLSAGRENNSFETWSSSKIFAMANAAGTMRSDFDCSGGLDMDGVGKNGPTPLGDLATIIVSYDETKGYTSNSLSSYFNDIGGRQNLDNLIHSSWLGAPSNQSLGGNYGEASPSDLKFEYFAGKQGKSMHCHVDPDHSGGLSNSYSTLSAIEMTRRLVLYEDTSPENRWPHMEYSDSLDEMYGASPSLFFSDLQWGGMTADTSIFVQASVNITDVEVQSQGRWRIFSKLGAGYSGSRDRGEIVNNAYACFPVLDEDGNPIPDQGHEFIISARSSVPHDTYLYGAQKEIHVAMEAAIQAIMNDQVN